MSNFFLLGCHVQHYMKVCSKSLWYLVIICLDDIPERPASFFFPFLFLYGVKRGNVDLGEKEELGEGLEGEEGVETVVRMSNVRELKF